MSNVRVHDPAELRRGAGFSIVEINGVGSEATHIWDREATLARAYADQFRHCRLAFAIAAANRARGFKPCGTIALARAWLRQRRLMAGYPEHD